MCPARHKAAPLASQPELDSWPASSPQTWIQTGFGSCGGDGKGGGASRGDDGGSYVHGGQTRKIVQARVKEKAAVATPAAEAAARMAQANPNPDDSAGEWAPVKKWLKKLRAEVAALLGETPVPPPPPPSVPPPPPGSDAAITEYLSRSLQDVGTASEYLSRSVQDVGTLALAQLRMLGQEKDEAVEAKAKAVEAAVELSKALQKANKDYVVAERTHAAEMAKLVAQTTAKRKATADVGTSTGSLPYYIAARKRRR